MNYRITEYSLRSCAFVVLGAIFISNSAVGADVNVQVRVGATHSDNVVREDANELSDKIATAGLSLEMSEKTNRFEGSFHANVNHNSYIDDTFDDETFTSFMGDANLTLVEETLSWIFTDNFGKLTSDPFEADTPNNREDVNRFSMGPVLNIRLGSATAAEISALYKNTGYEVSDFDHEVYAGTVSLIRALSSVRSISLNLAGLRTEYDNVAIQSNYDMQSADITFRSRVSRGEMNISIGANELHDSGTSSDGLFANISLSREISPAASISVGYDQRFSDAGDLFERYQEISPTRDESLPVLGTSDPLEISRFNAGYEYDKNDNVLSVSLSHGEYDYESDDFLDRDVSIVSFSARKQLGSAWHAGLEVRTNRTEFKQSSRTYDDVLYSLNFGRQMTRTLTIQVTAQRQQRDSNQAGFEYVENRYTLQVVYSPLSKLTGAN